MALYEHVHCGSVILHADTTARLTSREVLDSFMLPKMNVQLIETRPDVEIFLWFYSMRKFPTDIKHMSEAVALV